MITGRSRATEASTSRVESVDPLSTRSTRSTPGDASCARMSSRTSALFRTMAMHQISPRPQSGAEEGDPLRCTAQSITLLHSEGAGVLGNIRALASQEESMLGGSCGRQWME